jgi:hypothetical protein
MPLLRSIGSHPGLGLESIGFWRSRSVVWPRRGMVDVYTPQFASASLHNRYPLKSKRQPRLVINALPCLRSVAPRVDLFESSPVLSPSLHSPFATEIFPWLYLGNARDACDFTALAEKNIKYILNISKEDSPEGSPESRGYRYMKLSLDDNSDVPIAQYFDISHKFIEDARARNTGVLVHCRKGVSRSATIVIAYVMKHQGIPFEDAFEYVKQKRSIINPNLGFVLALEALEALDLRSPALRSSRRTPVHSTVPKAEELQWNERTPQCTPQ